MDRKETPPTDTAKEPKKVITKSMIRESYEKCVKQNGGALERLSKH